MYEFLLIVNVLVTKDAKKRILRNLKKLVKFVNCEMVRNHGFSTYDSNVIHEMLRLVHIL